MGVDSILTVFTHWSPAAIYVVAAVLIASETATVLGLVLPAEATLFVVGFLCYLGTLRLSIALPLMVVAALLGDSLGYRSGRRAGPRLRVNRLGQWVGDPRWTRADRLIERYGGRAVFLGRFVAFARTLTPRLVGVGGMPYRHFLLWDLCGVLGCVGGTVVVGYAAGSSYAGVSRLFGQATSAVLMLLAVIVALVLIGRYLGLHPDPVATIASRLSGWRPVRALGDAYDAGFSRLARRLGVGGAVAVHVIGGVLALLVVGYALTWAVGALITSSGLPVVDRPIMSWVEDHRTPPTSRAAEVILSVLRGPPLVILVGLVALAINWKSRIWETDLVAALGTMGAFVPLAVIAMVTSWSPPSATQPSGRLFVNQTVVVTASLGMLAWSLSRRFGWVAAVSAWMSAIAGTILVGTARVYLGWNWPSQTLSSVLLGGLWVLVFVVAWRARDRASIESDSP